MPKPEIIRCPTCHRKRTRTSAANSRYWLLLHLIADKVKPEGAAHSAEVWHEYFKQRFLGMDEFILPNKKVIRTQKSTAELETQGFSDYMSQVEIWAMDRDIYMDEADPT